ncbi:MAG TPA: sigma-54 dependent transcriptional regulator [Zeimonas sp.]|nr:sigma-54 dependent transcriptional regulator [Zeimonas sp.]
MDAATVLIVDDEPWNVDLLEQELGAAGYRTVVASGGEQAIVVAADAQPDLVLLDVMMTGIDGYETCRRLKAGDATRAIPVIFLTALKETFEKTRAFAAGAVDYVTKPFETEELLARVGVHIALRREIEAHRRSKATIRLMVEDTRADDDAMIGDSSAMRRVREQLAQVAVTDSTVLIQGETGTGKELVARAIHARSTRRDRPLIRLNCAALPRELVESELFGHEKGAFTGAIQQRRGRFELADGGTLFLDEVSDLPADAQAKLLRVLQEREFERLGGTRTLHVDVRVIAATNRDLHAEVVAGRFRADLYFRLNVFPIALPPLRERRDDVPRLLAHFAQRTARKLGRRFDGIAPAFVERARACDWPGNIRELENLVERALILSNGGPLDGSELLVPVADASDATADPTALAAPFAGPVCVPPGRDTLEDVERAHIRDVLERTRWRIEGELGAARALGLNPSTLRGRMRKLDIRRSG